MGLISIQAMKIDIADKKMSYSKIKKSLFPEIPKAEFDKIFQNQSYIGSGMQGEVYKATMGKQLVAIKYFRKQFIGVEYINYIKSEIQTLRDINHPNIVSLIDSYQVILGSQYGQRKYCIVCEYCSESLSNYYAIQNLTDLQKLKMCLQLASAIKAAHSKNIIHRDIKPQNILIKDLQTYMIKLADFGCCRIQQDDQNLSMTKNVGTPLYADPLISSGKYSKKCDVYSVGLVMVYIFCGKHYFSHCKTRELLIEAKTKFCMNIESASRGFLKKYELSFQIQQFLINISTFALSNNQQQRLNSDALQIFVKREIQSYQLIQQNNTEVKPDPQPPVEQKFAKSRINNFQEQLQPAVFTKPKKPQQEVKPNIIEEHSNIFGSPKKNGEIEKINLESLSFVVTNSIQSEKSDSKSRETTDRLTDKKLTLKSSNEGKPQIQISGDQSYNSAENEDFNISNGEITCEDVQKVEQKVNHTVFNKKSTTNDFKEQQDDSSSKLKNSRKIKIPIQKSTSSILQSNRRPMDQKSKSTQRKEKIELSYKQLSNQEQLCGVIIKHLSQSTNIKDECHTMELVLRKLKGVKSSFQVIKIIKQVQTSSMTLEQKQVIAFLFHSLYLFMLKDFRNFLFGGTSKLHSKFGKITEQDKQCIYVIMNKEKQRIWPNLKKYSNDLFRKLSLIRPKISTSIGNLIKDVMMCGNSQSLLDLNLSQKQLLTEGTNFINEKLRQIRSNDDRRVIEEIREGFLKMTN